MTSKKSIEQAKFFQAVTRWECGEPCFPEVISVGLSLDKDIQSKLALDCGTSETTISRWASGLSKPHPSLQEFVIYTIINMLGSSINDPILLAAIDSMKICKEHSKNMSQEIFERIMKLKLELYQK